MSGHGPIYDWSFFRTNDLKKVLIHLDALDDLGFILDEDLIASVKGEIREREKK